MRAQECARQKTRLTDIRAKLRVTGAVTRRKDNLTIILQIGKVLDIMPWFGVSYIQVNIKSPFEPLFNIKGNKRRSEKNYADNRYNNL
jgi:hypothetical protein